MNSLPENFSLHAQDLTRALFDFFACREQKEFHSILRNLLSKLIVTQIEKGRGFLNSPEIREITENTLELKAVGTEEDQCPLVITKEGRLYFRKSYEYELSIARFFVLKMKSEESMDLEQAICFFDDKFRGEVDEFQAWIWPRQ